MSTIDPRIHQVLDGELAADAVPSELRRAVVQLAAAAGLLAALPASPAFVPFVDALVNRLARGEAPVAESEGPPGVAFQIRGADTVGATVSGPDPRESDLTPAAAELVRGTIGAELLDEARFAAERFAGTRRADVSGLLLALALLVAAVELGVATLTP